MDMALVSVIAANGNHLRDMMISTGMEVSLFLCNAKEKEYTYKNSNGQSRCSKAQSSSGTENSMLPW